MNDQTRPRPEVGSQCTSIDRQRAHMGRGGIRRRPHDEQVCTSSSPRAQPSQNGADVGSSRSGSSHLVSTISGGPS